MASSIVITWLRPACLARSIASGVHGSDLPVLMLVVAPYGLLALMAAGARHRRAEAWTLLITAVLLGLGLLLRRLP